MKKSALLVLVLCVFATIVRAQDAPVVDLSVGYSVIPLATNFSHVANGASGSLAWNARPWLGVVADFGTLRTGADVTAQTYTFGPRFTYRHWSRLVPFGQILAGDTHASQREGGVADGYNALTISTGGGADLMLDHGGRFALRPQVEYIGFRANGNTTSTARLSLGFVINFGRSKRSAG